ncbi:MAG: helix-hairpin-helix domain-containing protein [Cyanobacteriota bacterium]
MSQNFGFRADRCASVGLAASGLLLVLLGMMPVGLAAPKPIRVIDRPAASETRAVLQQYGPVLPDALPAAVNWVLLKSDDTAEVISKPGKDGIGYAIASQLTQQTKARVVKLAVPQEVLPTDARYPLEQVGAIAYRSGSRVAAVAQSLTASPDGQALLAEARQVALDAGRPKIGAIAPDEVVLGGRGIGSLLKWVLLPLLVLGGLLKLVQFVLARQARRRSRELSAMEQAVSLGRSPDPATTRPAAAAKVITNSAQTRIPADTGWRLVTDAVVMEDGSDTELIAEQLEEQADEVEVPQADGEPENMSSEVDTRESSKQEPVVEPEPEPFLELNPDIKVMDAEIISEPESDREKEPELEPELVDESDAEAPLESTLSETVDSTLPTLEQKSICEDEGERKAELKDELVTEGVQNSLVTGLALPQALIGEPKQAPSLVATLQSEKQALELEVETLRSRLQDADTLRTQLEVKLETARAEQSDRAADLDQLRQMLASLTHEKESYWQALSGLYAAFVGETLNPGKPIDFAQLRPQIEHHQADLAALHDQLESSQREREAIAADLEAASAELHQANAERHELTNQIISLQQALEAQHDSDVAVEEEMRNLRTLLQSAQVEKADLEAQLGDLRSQLELTQREKDGIDQERVSLRLRLTELEGLETELHTELERVRSQAANAEAVVSEAEGVLSALRLELDHEKATRQELETEVTLLRASVAEATRGRAEEAAARAELLSQSEALTAQREALSAELTTLRAQLVDATAAGESAMQELTELRTQLEAIAAERETATLQFAALQTQFNEILQERDALTVNLTALNKQLVDNTATQDTLEAELAALQTQLSAVAAERSELVAQTEALRAQLNEIAEQRSAFETELSSLRPQIQKLTAERNALEAELVLLRARLEEKTQEGDRHKAELSILHAQINEITLEKDAFEAEITTLNTRIGELESERNAFEADLTTLQVQFDEFESGRETLESEVNTLRTQLQEVRDHANSAKVALESELEILREQLTQVTDERNEFEAELASIQKQQENVAQEREQERLALQGQIAVLQAQLATVNDDRTAVETEGVALRTQIEKTEAEWRSRVQSLETECKALRQAQAETQAQRETLQTERDTLTAQLAEMRLQLESLPLALTTQANVVDAGERVTIAPAHSDMPSIVVAPQDSEIIQAAGLISEVRRDPLRDISGIGPIYEQKLFSAGIYTFADLAALTPTQVQAIIRPAAWQPIFPAVWIEEAARFAQGVDIPPDTHHDPLRDINGIGPVYEQKLFDGGIFTFADLATATPEQLRSLIQPESWQRFDPEAWIAEAQVISGRSPFSLPAEVRRDPLRDINGIGPVYEQKLFDAGIYTFTDLAATTPQQLQAILQPAAWQRFTPDAWIAEAAVLAARSPELNSDRDPLYEINGIGPVYEQKLFAAGITTFAALAETTEAQLLEILQPAPWQRIFPNLWIEEARGRSRQSVVQTQPAQPASSNSAEPAAETAPPVASPATSPAAQPPSPPASKSRSSRRKPPGKRGKRR